MAEKQRASCREYKAAHKPELNVKAKERYDAMKAAGYRYRKDPADPKAKRRWVFVGLQETPKSASGAA